MVTARRNTGGTHRVSRPNAALWGLPRLLKSILCGPNVVDSAMLTRAAYLTYAPMQVGGRMVDVLAILDTNQVGYLGRKIDAAGPPGNGASAYASRDPTCKLRRRCRYWSSVYPYRA